ncbi:MAG: hypothetical protein R3E48_10540 [Burkholderiaceae bacterium]
MLKLHHLVDDKMHTRSTRPYSLVTQQPLGRKGAVRWPASADGSLGAQAYGASYTLQEMLTVKSDDVNGRTKVYENLGQGRARSMRACPNPTSILVEEIARSGSVSMIWSATEPRGR